MKTNHLSAISKFWDFMNLGKSAALDIDSETGEMVCRYSISNSGDEGNGMPAQTHTDRWSRIIQCENGKIKC